MLWPADRADVRFLGTHLLTAWFGGVLLQACEDIFELPHTEHALLADIRRDFEPISALWRMATVCSRQLPDWMDGPFNEIDAETVAADVDK